MTGRGGNRGGGRSGDRGRGRGAGGDRGGGGHGGNFGGGRGGGDRGSHGGGRGGGDRGGGFGGHVGGGRGGGDRGSGFGGNFGGGRGGGERGGGGFRGGGEFRGRGGGERGGGGFRGGGEFRGRGRGGGGGGGRGRDSGPRLFPGIYREGTEVPPPSTEITKFEDQSIADPAAQLSRMTVQDYERLPRRPAYGKTGNAITVRTNFFDINTKQTGPSMTIYRYALSFDNDAALSKPKTRRYFEILLSQSPFKDVAHASDFTANLYTLKKLDLPGSEADRAKYDVVIYDRVEQPMPGLVNGEPAERTAARTRKTRKLQVALTTSYNIKDLFDYVSSAAGNYNQKEDVRQALNIIFNHHANKSLVVASQQAGNKLYPFAHATSLGVVPLAHRNYEHTILGGGLIAIRGYYSSVRLASLRVVLNINVTAGAFFNPVNLAEFFDELAPSKSVRQYRALSKLIKRLKVAVTYVKQKNSKGQDVPVVQVKTLAGLVFQGPAPLDATTATFRADGRDTTVASYFRTKHGVDLKQPKLPVVNVGTEKERVLVPPELCTILGGQACRRTLTGDQTTKMLRFAARPPNYNQESIEETALTVIGIKGQPNQTIGNWGLNLGERMLTVPARILTAPRIAFKTPSQPPRDGSWNLNGVKFATASRMDGIFSSFQVRSSPNDGQTPAEFAKAMTTLVGELQKYSVSHQTYTAPEAWLDINYTEDKESFPKLVSDFDTKFKALAAKGVRWCLVAIPDQNKVRYAAIKYVADVKYGIHTVLMQTKNVIKITPSVGDRGIDLGMAGNIALKFSFKSRGNPWTLSAKDLPSIDSNTMVVGIDVTHPSPGGKENAPSIAAIVASIDAGVMNYLADGRAQTSRKEMVEGLSDLMEGRLRVWQKRNSNKLPQKILVFRDGVSEGQFQQVLDVEFKSMQEAFNKLYGKAEKHPKVSIIVCGKRHHTRFYPTKMADSDGYMVNGQLKGSMNTKPGLVVDRHVTGYGEGAWDFYIQPHKALQGTAKPCHYIVIKDQIGMKHEQLEQTIHTMCYGFARATKAVSLVPAAYCADRAAERFRCYLYDVMNDSDDEGSVNSVAGAAWTGGVHANLADSMFYL